MRSVARLSQRRTGLAPSAPSVRAAVEAFLDAPRINQSPHTRRAYAGVLDHLAQVVGADRMLADVADAEIGDALTRLWGERAESTWNRNRAAVGSWLAWCVSKQHWIAPTLPAAAERRREKHDSTQAVSRARIDRLCRRQDVPLREKTLWRMLYESASRAGAVLALNIEDLDLPITSIHGLTVVGLCESVLGQPGVALEGAGDGVEDGQSVVAG